MSQTKGQDVILKFQPIDMEKWQTINSEWEASQESQKEFCERLGISFNTFSYARSKLLQTKKSAASFIPLTISHPEDENPVNDDTVIIENPQGYKLHLSSSLSLDRLAKLFKLCGW